MANQYSAPGMADAEYLYKMAQLQNLMFGNGSGSEPFNYFDRYIEKQAEQAPFVTNAPAMSNPFGEFTNTLGQLANNAILEGQRRDTEQRYNNTSKLVSDYRISMSNALASGANPQLLEQLSNSFIQELGNNPDKYMHGIAYKEMDPTAYFRRAQAMESAKLAAAGGNAAGAGSLADQAKWLETQAKVQGVTNDDNQKDKGEFYTLLAKSFGAGNTASLIQHFSDIAKKNFILEFTDESGSIGTEGGNYAGFLDDDYAKQRLDRAYLNSKKEILKDIENLSNNPNVDHNALDKLYQAVAANDTELEKNVKDEINTFRNSVKSNRDIAAAFEKAKNETYSDRIRRQNVNNKDFFEKYQGVWLGGEDYELNSTLFADKIKRITALGKSDGMLDKSDYIKAWGNLGVHLAKNNATLIQKLNEFTPNSNLEEFISSIGESETDRKLLRGLLNNIGITDGAHLAWFIKEAKENSGDLYNSFGSLLSRSLAMDWSQDTDKKVGDTDYKEFLKNTVRTEAESGWGGSDLNNNYQGWLSWFGLGSLADAQKLDQAWKANVKGASWDADTRKRASDYWNSLRDDPFTAEAANLDGSAQDKRAIELEINRQLLKDPKFKDYVRNELNLYTPEEMQKKTGMVNASLNQVALNNDTMNSYPDKEGYGVTLGAKDSLNLLKNPNHLMGVKYNSEWNNSAYYNMDGTVESEAFTSGFSKNRDKGTTSLWGTHWVDGQKIGGFTRDEFAKYIAEKSIKEQMNDPRIVAVQEAIFGRNSAYGKATKNLVDEILDPYGKKGLENMTTEEQAFVRNNLGSLIYSMIYRCGANTDKKAKLKAMFEKFRKANPQKDADSDFAFLMQNWNAFVDEACKLDLINKNLRASHNRYDRFKLN